MSKYKKGYKVCRRVGRSWWSCVCMFEEWDTHYRIGMVSKRPVMYEPLYVYPEEKKGEAQQQLAWAYMVLGNECVTYALFECLYTEAEDKGPNSAIAETVKLTKRIDIRRKKR